MKTADVLVCCLLILPFIGPMPGAATGPVALLPSAPKITSSHRQTLENLLRQGRDTMLSGRLEEAEKQFEILWKSALDSKEFGMAARGKGNAGACQFAMHRYRDAARSFLEAHRLAEQAGDFSVAALFEANLASLYSEIGELESAVQWTERSLARVSGDHRKQHLASLQIQLGSLRARQGRMVESIALFRQGIETADRDRDLPLYATGWNRLGEELLRHKEYVSAEHAFLEAFRIRYLNRLPLQSSYTNLARARLQASDPYAAEVLLDLAMQSPEGPSGVPARDVYRLRGQVRLLQHRLALALEDLRIALRLERAWRWSAPTPDAAMIGAEGVLSEVHGALIETGNRLYLENGDPALIRETFEATEENRSYSLRLLIGNRQGASDIPPAHREAIARLQRAEVAALHGGAEAHAAARAARADLVRLEAARAPDALPLSIDVLDSVQKRLDPDSVLLSFHLGETASWLWAVDREGMALYPLPARNKIQTLAAQAVIAVRENQPGAGDPQSALYRMLFGDLATRFRGKVRWLLSLDRTLFDVPFSALVEESNGRREYLIERHTILIIPGAGGWLEAQKHTLADVPRDIFVGIGDPIYNTADPRISKVASERAAPLQLPRLVGSGAEIEACARAWNGEHILMRGSDVNRAHLLDQLQRNPAVVHFATHFLESSDPGRSAMIPLGIAEVLPGQEISQWRIHAGLVVLSGCHSAAGSALPGTGLLGLTRAWLAAGARSVIGSRWSTPDEDGALFGALYRRLREAGTNFAGALQFAQLEMLRGGGWRAQPRYWGAYSLVGNQ